MEVRISVRPNDQVESLQDWLALEPELRPHVRAVGRAPIEGHLGSVTDLLTVAVGAGGALSVLASSLRVWLNQPRRSDVHIIIHGSDGSVVEVDAKRVDDVAMLLKATLPHTDGV
jgi:hypothetical protein